MKWKACLIQADTSHFLVSLLIFSVVFVLCGTKFKFSSGLFSFALFVEVKSKFDIKVKVVTIKILFICLYLLRSSFSFGTWGKLIESFFLKKKIAWSCFQISCCARISSNGSRLICFFLNEINYCFLF